MEDPVKSFEAALGEASNPQFKSALSKLFSSSYSLPGTEARVGAQGAIDQINQRNAEIAKSNRIDEIKARLQEIQDQTDPAKYQKVKRADGGFDFFNPKGEKISAGEFAQVQGKSIADLFSDSDNLYEIEFKNDYEQWKKLGEAWQKGDTKQIEKLLEQNPDELKAFKKGQTFEEFTKKFIDSYGDLFGGRGAGTSEVASTPLARAPSTGDQFRDRLKNLPLIGGFFRGLDSDPNR